MYHQTLLLHARQTLLSNEMNLPLHFCCLLMRNFSVKREQENFRENKLLVRNSELECLFFKSLCLTPSGTVTTNLNCQIDWLWNKQKSNPVEPLWGIFLARLFYVERSIQNMVGPFWWQPRSKNMDAGNFALCLLTLALTGKFICQHSFADIRTSSLRHPTQTVAPASSNSSVFKYQIGPVKTSTSWAEQLSDSQPL